MEMNHVQNIFITFGAGRSGWIGAAKRITAEAQRTGLFEFSFNLDERWLKAWDPEIYEIGLNLRKTMPARGFGYWTWKPSVLLWAHLNFPNHQIVYVDAGSQFKTGNLKKSELAEDLNASTKFGGLAWALDGYIESVWTKVEVFNHLNLDDEFRTTPQIQSGFIALPQSSPRYSLIQNWRELAKTEEGFYFTDQSNVVQPPEFIEHRHDQSILSCLWKRSGFPLILDKTNPSQSNLYPIIAWRNNSILRIEQPWVFRKALKFAYLLLDMFIVRRR